MLHAHLDDPATYDAWLRHPVWRRALDWLKTLPAEAALGRQDLLGDDMFALIQAYDTLPREQARFESHEEHIDLQYTLAGEEAIDWHPRAGLQPDGAFGSDVQFWHPPATPYATLIHAPRRFSIFFPGDAHRPKVRAHEPSVRKLVIKIRVGLVA